MSLRPTRRDENHAPRHPRENGGPWLVSNTMDSRFRGNDVIFAGVIAGLRLTPANGNPPPSSRRNTPWRKPVQINSL